MQKEADNYKFICDFMVQKLGRILILCGFDTNIIKKPISKDEIISIAESEKRIIITRNTGFKHSKQCFILKEQNSFFQFKKIITVLNLKIDISKFFTRCSSCNIVLEKIETDKIKDLIPPMTLKNTSEYFICKRCQKLYWKASHYDMFIKKIKTITSDLNHL